MALHKGTGRVRWFIARSREFELRWVGTRVQWVVSPVQVALWTHMHKPGESYNWRLNWCPMRRSVDLSALSS